MLETKVLGRRVASSIPTPRPSQTLNSHLIPDVQQQRKIRGLSAQYGGQMPPCNAVAVETTADTSERQQSAVEIPTQIANSVVRLQAPNAAAANGHTEVYLLGMSHVSKASVSAVKSLIGAVKPELSDFERARKAGQEHTRSSNAVQIGQLPGSLRMKAADALPRAISRGVTALQVVLIEVCMDRVGLMMNPDGPRELQLWASRKIQVSGLPTAEGWPSESDILSVVSTRAGRAFSMPDVEADCVRLLATGLFRSVRPSVKRPTTMDCPQYVRVSGSRIATAPPLGTVEFIISPRKLPAASSFSVRVDSSLGRNAVEVPEEDVKAIEKKLLEDCGMAQPSSSQESAEGAEKTSTTNPKQEPPSAPEARLDAASAPESQPEAATPPESDPAPSAEPEKPQKQRAPNLDALMQARKTLAEIVSRQLVAKDFDISLNGVETGEIEAIIKARQSKQGFSSGLENSAVGGEGYGIETFKPQRGPLQISSNLRIPNLAKVIRREGENSDDFVTSVTPQSSETTWRPWSEEEKQAADAADDDAEDKSIGARLANILSQTYAKFQNKAAESAGIKPGAAWRAALEAASEHGGRQVILGDMPADLAARNLANGIWEGLSTRIASAAIVTALAATSATAHLLPSGAESYAAASVAAAFGLAAFPFLGPLAEIYFFSRKSAAQLEEAVRIKEPLQARGTEMLRLPGEDVIIRWPNAKETIIDVRDKYMARTLYAAATGIGASPAYILDTSGERHVWRYVMPKDAPEGCSMPGCGDGEYEPLKAPKAVVGIVGSAHVGGILREWANASETSELSQILGEEES